MRMNLLRRVTVALLLGLAAGLGVADDAKDWSHAWAAYGEPKYPRGFAHFDWANPDAPKGGTLVLRQVQPLHATRCRADWRDAVPV
jgi:microcin C transport system substrate-binding protein